MSWKQGPLLDEDDAAPPLKRSRRSKHAQRGDSWKKVGLEEEPVNDGSTGLEWKKAPLCNDGAAPVTKRKSTGKAWKKLPMEAEKRILSDSDDDHGMQDVVTVHLSLPLLRMLPLLDEPATSYAANGMSKDRCQEVCASNCRCQKNCIRAFNVRQVKAFNAVWHLLSMESQMQVLSQLFNPQEKLHVLQNEQGRKWKIDDVDVCFAGFCKFLGMAPRSVLRMAHGINDMRSLAPSAHQRIALQRSVCSHFFMEVYISAAEALPEVETPAEKTEEVEGLEFSKSFRWCMEIDVPQRINLLVGEDASPPVRYLPPGRLMDLWWQFLSWCETQRLSDGGGKSMPDAETIPSWATFYRVWKQLFHHRCLEFREKNQHAQCDDCFSLKEQLGKMRLSPTDRVRIAPIRDSDQGHCCSQISSLRSGPALEDSTARQWRVASQALASDVVSKQQVAKIKETVSGTKPLAQRKQLLKLLDSARLIYVESARAISRKACIGEEIYEAATAKGGTIIPTGCPGLFTADASPMESFMRKVILAMHEMERDVVVSRLQAGLMAKQKVSRRKTQSGNVKVNGRFSLIEKLKPNKATIHKMNAVLKQRSRGDYGWREAATRLSKLLKMKTTMAVETARRVNKELHV
eukprot:Skav231388  [mRNA]  locus=scaffold6335:4778:7274:- [translate_table: standard]